jgi:divalent metal cation (Fe/Co/Zn/Cd) transporter
MTEAPVRHDPSAGRAVVLETFSVGMAVFEAIAALISGLVASSFALIAFGADSVIEVLSAVVVVVQLASMLSHNQVSARSNHWSHRLIALLFYLLALYVTISTAVALTNQVRASENGLGFAVCIASAVLMPGLAFAKRGTSRAMARQGLPAVSRLLAADASETALCAVLSVSTLTGIGLTAWLGWWWADPVASLLVVFFALREGREAWRCATV